MTGAQTSAELERVLATLLALLSFLKLVYNAAVFPLDADNLHRVAVEWERRGRENIAILKDKDEVILELDMTGLQHYGKAVTWACDYLEGMDQKYPGMASSLELAKSNRQLIEKLYNVLPTTVAA